MQANNQVKIYLKLSLTTIAVYKKGCFNFQKDRTFAVEAFNANCFCLTASEMRSRDRQIIDSEGVDKINCRPKRSKTKWNVFFYNWQTLAFCYMLSLCFNIFVIMCRLLCFAIILTVLFAYHFIVPCNLSLASECPQLSYILLL